MAFSRCAPLVHTLYCISKKGARCPSQNYLNDLPFNLLRSYCVDSCAQTRNYEVHEPAQGNLHDIVKRDDGIHINVENWTTQTEKLKNASAFPLIQKPEDVFYIADNLKMPNALDKCNEDLSYLGPYMEPTATFAKYANESKLIQRLVQLGVDLSKIEQVRGAVAAYLSLDFDINVAPYIQFLHDIGITPDNIGRFITKNPYIFFQDMRNLRLRLKYLEEHRFTKDMIVSILIKHPAWLSYNLKGIDRRLGFFQTRFRLTGPEVRQLALQKPNLITENLIEIQKHTITITGQMEFSEEQTKMLLLKEPKIWKIDLNMLVDTFDFVHNEMGLSQEEIVNHAKILTMKKLRCKERHMFLKELKKAQYDPTKPLYISPSQIIMGSDVDFCNNVANCHVELYNKFLRTL